MKMGDERIKPFQNLDRQKLAKDLLDCSFSLNSLPLFYAQKLCWPFQCIRKAPCLSDDLKKIKRERDRIPAQLDQANRDTIIFYNGNCV